MYWRFSDIVYKQTRRLGDDGFQIQVKFSQTICCKRAKTTISRVGQRERNNTKIYKATIAITIASDANFRMCWL